MHELQLADDNTISRSTKGGKMVIMRTLKLEQLCIEHLSYTNTCEKLNKDPRKDIRIKINKTIEHILNSCNFPASLITNL